MKTHVTSKLRLTFFFICIALAAEAKVKLPTLIADGMVIQREQPVKLWGSADPGEKVIITFNKKRYETTADEKGEESLYQPAESTSRLSVGMLIDRLESQGRWTMELDMHKLSSANWKRVIKSRSDYLDSQRHILLKDM